jgi:Flp pilus assembly pilin Flp
MSTQHLTALTILLQGRIAAQQRRRRSEAGASAVEWVVITAILVSVTIAVGLILTNKIKGKAEGIDLGS